ncbi:DUF4376 domain-containing protein [Alishewanella sp. 16-MA]|uniref:DUF4376 domain-containing protein n=1 Tax=Alishewanella maricola TaxID=2795740 RepID=A0ABS8C2G5_9ALTE|nr:DUF4376 domain-containing protein [Alishewanella maricola]MCB5226190.1 DUF4376 domain-containing protein [Alishewanella maricola]
MSINWQTLRTAQDIVNEYKQSQAQWLNTERDRLINAGITHNGHQFQTREKDVADLMGVIQVAQLTPNLTTRWLTENNTEVEMNLQQLQALGIAVAQHKTHLVYRCRQHKDAIAALTTKEAVDNYISNISW